MTKQEINVLNHNMKQYDIISNKRPCPLSLVSRPFLLRIVDAITLFFFLFSFSSCTFDYGDTGASENDMPDLIMENLEYVRVQSGNLLALVHAERLERYERAGLMKVQNLSFNQYGEGESITVTGTAGNATVEMDTNDILMSDKIVIEILTEDIIMETSRFEWIDESRTLSTREDDNVLIYRDDGTRFMGIGLVADARKRTWEFFSRVSGIYVYEDDE